MLLKTRSNEFDASVNFIGAHLLEFKFSGLIPGAEDFAEFSIVTGRGKELPIRGYNTLYKVTEDGFILSNDESVYTEQEVEEIPIEEPIEEVPAFSIEDRLEVLEGAVMEIAELLYS